MQTEQFLIIGTQKQRGKIICKGDFRAGMAGVKLWLSIDVRKITIKFTTASVYDNDNTESCLSKIYIDI